MTETRSGLLTVDVTPRRRVAGAVSVLPSYILRMYVILPCARGLVIWGVCLCRLSIHYPCCDEDFQWCGRFKVPVSNPAPRSMRKLTKNHQLPKLDSVAL